LKSTIPDATTSATLILGDMSIHGNTKPLRSLTEPLRGDMDNGAKRTLFPIEDKCDFLEVPEVRYADDIEALRAYPGEMEELTARLKEVLVTALAPGN